MTIFEIFKQAVELGIEHDFRPREEVLNYHWQEEIKNGAGESFVNPYADTGVAYVKDLNVGVARVAVGLDLAQDELLAIEEWEEDNNKKVDLFISHHPRGRVLISFPHILKTQIGNLKSQGVDTEGLEKYYDERLKEALDETLSINFYRTYDTLKLLKRNYINIHTPLDNVSVRFIQESLQKSGAETLGDCVEALAGIPEYKTLTDDCGIRPAIQLGKPSDKLGKALFTEFTGGEEGPIEVYRHMKRSGVDTLVVMHMTADALDEIKKLGMNVVAAGHIASDSIGMNLFCDILEDKGIEVVPLGGLVRCHH